MTIKQSGGVFGRNPSFNDVDVQDLTAQNVDINGGTIDGTTIGANSAAAGSFTTVSASGDVTITDKIVHAGDTDTAIRFPADDTVAVETAGSPRIWISPSGNAGFGTSFPYAKLEINSGDNAGAIRVSEANHNESASTFRYTLASYWARQDNVVRTGSDPLATGGSTAAIVFTDTPGNSSFPNAVRSSAIEFWTADNLSGGSLGQYPQQRVTIDSSGHAIIPAGVTLGTAAGVYTAANNLDDYEEGTWTPVDASGAGLTFTGFSGNCFYTKIGNLVTCSFALVYPSTADTNPTRITGLPFTSKSVSDSNASGSISYTDSGLSKTIIVGANSTMFMFYKFAGATVNNNEVSGKAIRGTITYMV